MPAETLALISLASAKLLTYVGLFGLTGAAIVWLVVIPRVQRRSGFEASAHEALRRQTPRIALVSAALLAAGAVARLYAQTYSTFGIDEPVTAELIRVVAFDSRWGSRWMPQLWATVVAIAAAAVMTLKPGIGWWLVAIGIVLCVVTLPITGHVMAYPAGSLLPWMLQVGHILAGGLWLGTLATLVFVIASSKRSIAGGATATVIGLFSPLAIVAVSAVVVTGVGTAYLYLDSWIELWQTSYGQVLVAKVILMLATGAVGAYNWRFLKPRLGTSEAGGVLVRSSILELMLACIVLVVTAVLVHLPMPGE